MGLRRVLIRLLSAVFGCSLRAQFRQDGRGFVDHRLQNLEREDAVCEVHMGGF